MKKHIIIVCMVALLVVAMCVPCSAVQVEQYSYNGAVLPKLPESDCEYARIFEKEGKYYLWLTYEPSNLGKAEDLTITGMGQNLYKVSGSAWVKYTPVGVTGCKLYWSNYDVTSSDGALTFPGSNFVLTRIEKAELDEISGPFEAIAQELTVQNVVEILVVLVGATVGLVFMWWGSRKLVRACMTAFRKGRVKV